jgi:hypothetical protein
VGHSFTVSIALSRFVPSGRSFRATMTRVVGTRLCSFVVWRTRNTPKVAATAVTIAAEKTRV